jgi:3D-(3,5/4)-trihydroxycyclohexane-1,2-dione acylhydrolase (decyclizing)
VKLARPDKEVIVMVGDGAYMMMNSELATSVLLGRKLIVVVLDNRGYGCIHRLQRASGSPPFNNMLDDCIPEGGTGSSIDFAAHARSMGAQAVHARNIAALRIALVSARAANSTQLIVIDTSAERTTADGGCWWEVAIPAVSARAEVKEARARYEAAKRNQKP